MRHFDRIVDLDPRAWNHWNRLQRRLWQVVGKELPSHMLILSGDSFGSLEELYESRPNPATRIAP